MTPEQAEVVARIRAAAEERNRSSGIARAAESEHRKLLRAVSRVDKPTIRITRVAARYAHLWGVSIPEAARVFGIYPESVRSMWHRMYPGERPVAAR